MNRVKVECEVETYPDDEKAKSIVHVVSHWNRSDRVHIQFAGKEVVVIGRDIITAIENCMRTG